MAGEKSSKSAKSAKSSRKEPKQGTSSSSKAKGKAAKEGKADKGGKSERASKKGAAKSGRSSASATPTRQSKSRNRDGSQRSKSKSPSNIDAMSQMKSHLGDAEEHKAATTLPVSPHGGSTLIGAGQTMTMPAEGLFRTQPILNPHVTQSRSCMLHSKPLRYFCDSCEELLCYDCTVMGPHNTQLHRICNMDEALRF